MVVSPFMRWTRPSSICACRCSHGHRFEGLKQRSRCILRGPIPSVIHISDGKLHDVNVLDRMIPEPAAIYVIDRAYLDFKRLFMLHQVGAFFSTKRSRARYYLRPDGCTVGVLQSKELSAPSAAHSLQRYRVKENLIFLTNLLASPATTICALYKVRWQVELFFKWIKQHLRIKQFYGTSENAVKAQIWAAVSVYVLIAIIKKRLNLDGLPLHFVTDSFSHPVRKTPSQ